MFTFDYNGNILTQQRYEGSTLVDNLTYQYATNSTGDLLSNRLYSVDDSVTVASLSATDMEDMPLYNNASPNTSNNYKYTQIGELKSDNQEEISEIHWRVDSKISEITRTSGSAKKNLKFEYDAMGNRVAKHVYAGSVLESSTYYVRDAQGNVMGVYEHKMDAENAVLEYRLIERNIYGSAQVGISKDTVDLNITSSAGALTQATYYHARQLNHRQYSLSNHLGNVLTTIGDGKAPVDSNSDGVIDYYTAYIISVSDYSPFGVELADRTWSIEEYRSGFNGKEKVNEITGNSSDYDFGARIYDARIGRWMSVDPMAERGPEWSTYRFCFDNPIINIDVDGCFEDWVENGAGTIYWDDNATSQETTKSGETWLGKNVILVTHQRIGTGINISEPINSAKFEIYLEKNKIGPSATFMGNTVSDDSKKYAVIAEGLYDAKVGHRSKYGPSDKAIIINNGGDVPTVNDKGSKGHFATGIYFHKGNNYQESLHDSRGNAYSQGCLLSGCYKGSNTEHDKFYNEYLSTFNGKLYLRAQPLPTEPEAPVVPNYTIPIMEPADKTRFVLPPSPF